MTADDSIIDIDVTMSQTSYFQLLRRLPPEMMDAFIGPALAWEREHVLAARLERYRRKVLPVFQAVPPLRAEAQPLASRWAELHFERGRNVVMPMMYAEDPRVTVEVLGGESVAEVAEPGRGLIVVSAHSGPYQALPAFMARTGERSVASFMDAAAVDLISRVYHTFVPGLAPRLDVIGLPSPDATQRAFSTLRSGGTLMVMPEFTLGEQRAGRTHTVPFLGREAYAPTGPARLARALRVPMVPARLLRRGPAHYVVKYDEPLFVPGGRETADVVTDRVFAWLERVVREDPAAWWCWEIFEQMIAASSDEAAARREPVTAASLEP